MNWTETVVGLITGLILGALSGFVWPRLRDRSRQKHAQKRTARELAALTSEILAAVRVKPHGVENKERWAERLTDLAESSRAWMDIDSMIAATTIAHRISDESFSHSRDAGEYCCDELVVNLKLLQLMILPHVADSLGWNDDDLEREGRRLMADVWSVMAELYILPPGVEVGEYELQQSEDWYEEWRSGRFRVAPCYAVSGVLEQGQKE